MPRPTYAQIIAAALIVIAIAFAWGFLDKARRAEERAAVAERQAEFNGEATRQLDHYTTTTTVIREKAQEAEREVQTAPGANAPLDPDNRRTLCAALERVRGEPACTD